MTLIKPGRGPHFAQVPWALQDDPEADAATIAAYAALQRFADFGGERGARVSDRTAAEKAGLSERTLRDRRERLKRMGWVDWTTETTKSGRINVYIVHRVRKGVRQEAPHGGVRQVLPDRVRQEMPGASAPAAARVRQDPPTTESHIPRANTETVSPASRDGAYPPEFERAWSLYPKRAGSNPKKDALREWRARVESDRVSPEEIEQGVRRYAAYCQATGNTGTEYVMQAKTFFGPSDRWRESYDLPVDRRPTGPVYER